MWDPNYDPYEQLERANHNIAELIRAINHHSEVFKELALQHNNLIAVVKDLQIRISVLETQNRKILSQIIPETV